jgi:hypothetical protein
MRSLRFSQLFNAGIVWALWECSKGSPILIAIREVSEGRHENTNRKERRFS